jgi:diguanylate cyclase (GGDEF)-like protein
MKSDSARGRIQDRWQALLSRLDPNLGELEPAFRAATFAETVSQLRIILFLTICMWIIFGGVDYVMFGPSPTLVWLYLLRATAIAVTSAGILLMRRIRSPRVLDLLAVLWVASLVLMILVVDLTRVRAQLYNGVLDTIVVLMLYLVLPNRLAERAICPLLLSVGTILLVVFWPGLPIVSVVSLAVGFLVANLIGIVISGSLMFSQQNQFSLQQETKRLATTDELTGIMNRRHFIEQASIEMERAARGSSPLSILMLDLDHFKKINDSYGHLAGDEALRCFAEQARAIIRCYDLFGRIGGEEFAILLPGTDLQPAAEIAERIRLACRDITSRDFTPKPGRRAAGTLTVSIGATILEASDESLDDLLSRADQALYLAKVRGRNRVEVV